MTTFMCKYHIKFYKYRTALNNIIDLLFPDMLIILVFRAFLYVFSKLNLNFKELW